MNCIALITLTGFALLMGTAPAQVGSGSNPAFTEQFEAGKHALNERRYKDAAGAFKKAVKLQPDCYACYTGLAAADLKLGDGKGALESCDKAIAAAKDDSSRAYAHNLKGHILLATAEDSNQMATAEAEFRTAIQLDRMVAAYHLNLATALIRQS